MPIELRALLLMASVLSATLPLGGQSCTEPGKARWAIKSSVTPAYKQSSPKHVSLSDLLALPEVPGVTKNDHRYIAVRIPIAAEPGLKEGDKVVTEGYFRLVATEGNDCEYHMQLSDASTDTAVFIVEVAKDDVASLSDPWVRAKASQVRTFVRTKLVAGNEPSGSGNVMQHSVYVKVTGQLFYDDWHIGDLPRGKKHMKSPTLWEIHPVTAISFAPKP